MAKARFLPPLLPPLLTAALVSSCAAPAPGTDEVVTVGDGTRILVHGFSSAPEALVHGELAYLPEERCLLVLVRDEESGEVVESAAPLWPDNVVPLEDGRGGVEEPALGAILDGDRFTAAGGHRGADPEWDVDLPEACVPNGAFVILNEDSFEPGRP
ncbi:hypothetical protein [Nocardiopsis ganjiahuensis]|uniref:hypothetical protein n=1 Tax=Nocardiopsis ganjiahuensis TaxID=239984 RepID=UPI000376FE18|nr:hypothetical protein [Nocardiopsis ganjiahuensis]